MTMPDFSLFPTDSNGVKNFGWAGPQAAKDAWSKVKKNFNPFKLDGKLKKKSKSKRITKGNERKRFQTQIIRQVVGKDLLNYAQQAGSCVSEGARTCSNSLACTNVLLLKKPERFKESYAPYHYGCMRVFVGAKHGINFGYNEDGGIGSLMAESFSEYGNLFADTDGLPEYTGQAKIARDWGYRPGPKKQYIELGKQHLIKTVARIQSWEDFVDAITNGYPVHFCSMLSFTMQPNSKGFHEQTNEGWAHCGKRDSFVNSYNGKMIQDIQVGDLIFGHDGKLHKVTETLKTKFEGKLIKISCGSQHISVTSNHPILAYVSQENEISDYRDVDSIGDIATLPVVKNEVKLIAKWMKASELKKGDYLVAPGYIFEKTEDFPKFVIPNDGQKRNIPNDLFVDDDIAWFFGMYAGDGNSSEGHKVRITLSSKEYNKAARCIKALNKLGLKGSIIKVRNKNAIRVICYSSILAQFMQKEFGKGVDKHLPGWIFTTGLNLREVVNGLIESDGHTTSSGRKIFSNTSKVLVNQVHTILISLGECPFYSNRIKHKNPRNQMYEVSYSRKPSKKLSKWINNHYLKQITSISDEEYSDYVYNLEVDDVHTYIMEGFISHNCMSFLNVDDEWKDPYVDIMNSWGDAHGQIKDVYTGELMPKGMLRVRKSVIARALEDDDVEAFALSDMDGFYERKKEIDTALFDLFGN